MKKSRALVVSPRALSRNEALAVRSHTERALTVTDPESMELTQGMRRGRSGETWTAPEAALALAGARDVDELLAVTREILPVTTDPGAGGLSSIRKTPWQQLLEEHPPDNAD